MVHLARRTVDGFEQRSRYWFGHDPKLRVLGARLPVDTLGTAPASSGAWLGHAWPTNNCCTTRSSSRTFRLFSPTSIVNSASPIPASAVVNFRPPTAGRDSHHYFTPMLDRCRLVSRRMSCMNSTGFGMTRSAPVPARGPVRPW